MILGLGWRVWCGGLYEQRLVVILAEASVPLVSVLVRILVIIPILAMAMEVVGLRQAPLPSMGNRSIDRSDLPLRNHILRHIFFHDTEELGETHPFWLSMIGTFCSQVFLRYALRLFAE